MAEINNFRFGKTDGRHIGLLFPFSIFTNVSSSACHFTSACQIL